MFVADPEAADLQQRLRAAGDAIATELRAAGQGAGQGALAGPLSLYFAPIMPMRRGRRSADPPGTFRRDIITVLHAVPGAAHTTTASSTVAQTTTVRLSADPGCPPGDPACGFSRDMDVALYDRSGAYDTFTVTNVAGDVVSLRHNMTDAPTMYPAGARLSAVTCRTFFLRTDSSGASQLMQYDGAGGNDVPVADHVVALRFEYAADPAPPAVLRPLAEAVGPWTSYGPAPPPVSEQPTTYPPGENCVFARDAAGEPLARLPWLGPAGTLVPLSAAQLTDGPWCPDASSPNRYDADLLRVRQVKATLRVEAAAAAVRGPAGLLFTHAGTSPGGARLVPDQELSLVLSIRATGVGP
jgi:hypothetical protein